MKRTFLFNLFCLLTLFGLHASTNAQTSGATNPTVTTSAIAAKTDGTYQIQVINSRNQPFIPSNIDELVTKNRQEKEVKYITLGTEVRLMILPLATINVPNFKPIDRIAYLKE